MEISIFYILIALLVIDGLAIRWYQIKAWRNSSHGVKGFLFKIGLFSNPENFNEEGKRYLKISKMLFIPEIILLVTLMCIAIIFDT